MEKGQIFKGAVSFAEAPSSHQERLMQPSRCVCETGHLQGRVSKTTTLTEETLRSCPAAPSPPARTSPAKQLFPCSRYRLEHGKMHLR